MSSRLSILAPNSSSSSGICSSSSAACMCASTQSRKKVSWPSCVEPRSVHSHWSTYTCVAAKSIPGTLWLRTKSFPSRLAHGPGLAYKNSGLLGPKKPSCPTVSRCTGSMPLTYAAISSTQPCSASPLLNVMLYMGPLAARRCVMYRSAVERGSFMRSKPKMAGSSRYARPLKVFTRVSTARMCALYSCRA